jgi:hypothetical protein
VGEGEQIGRHAGLYLGRTEATRRWSRPGDGVDQRRLLELAEEEFR